MSTGVVIGVALANVLVGIFITPRLLFAVSRNSWPPFLYTIMSSTRLPAPNSAIVVPRTFSPGLEVGDRELDERRAGVAGDQILLVVDRVRHERVHRRTRLELPCDCRDRSRRSCRGRLGERIRDRAELRRELLVREPGDPEAAVGERHVGDDLGARVGAAAALATGAFGSSTLWNFSGLQRDVRSGRLPSIRNSAGAAPAPCPRITET